MSSAIADSVAEEPFHPPFVSLKSQGRSQQNTVLGQNVRDCRRVDRHRFICRRLGLSGLLSERKTFFHYVVSIVFDAEPSEVS